MPAEDRGPPGDCRGDSVMVRTYHWTLRYGIALAASIMSTAAMLRVQAIARSGVSIPFLAVLISVWFGGLGPGLFTTVLGLVIYLIVLVHHGNQFPPSQILQIFLFVSGGVMINVLVEALHRARRRAESNGRWLSAVLTSIGDAVIVTDGQGRVCFTNPVARTLTGWAEEREATGRPLEEVFNIISEYDRRPVENPAARVIRDGVVLGLANHTALIARDGTERPIADSAAPIRDHEDKIVGVVLVFRDVTDVRRHEEERERLLAAEHAARSMAETANRTKDRFLAVLSHELRTPLTPVLIAASSLLEQGDHSLDPSVRSVLEMVQRNVKLESRLIDDLLDVSRIARGRLGLDLEVVDVHQVIRRALEICRDELLVAGLFVETDLHARHNHVMADHARLMQVAWNLIHNAVKFTPADGRLAIRTTNRPGPPGPGEPPDTGRPQRLVIEFEDSGIGIDPQILPRIFDAFEQGHHDLRSRAGGLGLGLAISRSLATAMGGQLTASSHGRGSGSTFQLVLPTVPAPTVMPVSKPAVASPESPTVAPRRRALRILLVEDNADTLRFLATVLRKRGHEVVTADCIAAARALVDGADVPFDLFLSDVELPDGTGLELMRDLRSRGNWPGIAMSGFGSEDDLLFSREAGFAEHLTKPIDLGRLEAAILRVTSPLATHAGSGGLVSLFGTSEGTVRAPT
jgi:PAS domain S-box-containing protein